MFLFATKDAIVISSKYRVFETDRTTHQNQRNRVFCQFLRAVAKYDAKKTRFLTTETVV